MATLFFDKKDYELLQMVNAFQDKADADPLLLRLFDANLHPHGIKELAISTELRVAYAVINLLDSLEAGKIGNRLQALAILQMEVFSAGSGIFRHNTARVLVQIMKELIRAHGNSDAQLELAHDFRMVAAGKPSLVRQFLKQYHLLEMPEEWNQIAFDNHVHDANTKGRKNPTQLILDAWIKGLRHLTVVYYNYIEPAAVHELLQAAETMGVSIRIGIEFKVPINDKYADFIWVPYGFTDIDSCLSFFAEAPIRHLMQEGKKATQYVQKYILDLLESYNTTHRKTLSKEFELSFEALDTKAFLTFVGNGQASLIHLCEFVHSALQTHFIHKVETLQALYPQATEEKKQEIEARIAQMNTFTVRTLAGNYFSHNQNSHLPNPHVPPTDTTHVPDILHMTPMAMYDWLATLRGTFHVTLNLADLTVEDVLELLWETNGGITHLEVLNLKDWVAGSYTTIQEINDLQAALNSASAPRLKQLLHIYLKQAKEATDRFAADRSEKILEILRNIPRLQNFYKGKLLRSRFGSDSIGRTDIAYGMGLALIETLPPHVQKNMKNNPDYSLLPIVTETYFRESWHKRNNATFLTKTIARIVHNIPILRRVALRHSSEWVAKTGSVTIVKGAREGNVLTLGGNKPSTVPQFTAEKPVQEVAKKTRSFRYLNTTIANVGKVLLGFIPAFLVMQHTQNWWFLVWFGAPIWFLITCIRNIVQSVVAGAGLRHSPLLRWNNYVSWGRLCDDLFFTGISVVLLELLIRRLLLEEYLGIFTATNPFLVFSIISMVNCVFISGQNFLSGLPRHTIISNILRSSLAIPLAVLYFDIFYAAILVFNFGAFITIIQDATAIILKMASDTVASWIEGYNDKLANIRRMRWDYTNKLPQLFNSVAKLEILFPEEEVLEKIKMPKIEPVHLTETKIDPANAMEQAIKTQAQGLDKLLIIHSLDLLYFWMYQPRAQEVLASLLKNMSADERNVYYQCQLVLRREREVSQLFVDGLVGTSFSPALSFYLERHKEYLKEISVLKKQIETHLDNIEHYKQATIATAKTEQSRT